MVPALRGLVEARRPAAGPTTNGEEGKHLEASHFAGSRDGVRQLPHDGARLVCYLAVAVVFRAPAGVARVNTAVALNASVSVLHKHRGATLVAAETARVNELDRSMWLRVVVSVIPALSNTAEITLAFWVLVALLSPHPHGTIHSRHHPLVHSALNA